MREHAVVQNLHVGARELAGERSELVAEAVAARRVGEHANVTQLRLVGLACEHEREDLAQRETVEDERGLTRLAPDDSLAFDDEHERRRNIRNAVGFGAQGMRLDSRGAQLGEPSVHALFRDRGNLRRSRGEPGANREHHLIDIVGQRFFERERDELTQARLARSGQRGFGRKNVDGVDQRRAAPAGERRLCGLQRAAPETADEPPGAVECTPGRSAGIGHTKEERFCQATRLRDCGIALA